MPVPNTEIVPSGFSVILSTPRSSVVIEPHSLLRVCRKLGCPTKRRNVPSALK
jgi:hypothetical protein